MKTRREIMGSVVTALVVPWFGCGGTSADERPAARLDAPATPSEPTLQLWDPIDPMFNGCAGG